MLKKLLWGLLALLLLATLAVAVWMSIPFAYQLDRTQQALLSDDAVLVSQTPWYQFVPKAQQPTDGVIFYPGGKTAPETFAPVMRHFAEQGMLAVIVPMPLNTAFLGVNKADAVMAAYPAIERWHLIGHSLGGVAAAAYANRQPEQLSSLLFWASYPASDLSALTVPTLSLSAALDSQTTPEKIQAYRQRFPANTLFMELPAANHWQYGYFADALNTESGLQSRNKQIEQLVAHSLAFIHSQQPVDRLPLTEQEPLP